jgi:(p)ppGpp synthase/HD superfamily hydrolase
MSTLQKAEEIAFKAHLGVTDKFGSPYINHVTRVKEMGTTDEEKIVGVLHDVVEDTPWTFELLEKEGFSNTVIEALKCVTKHSEEENYEDFTLRVSKNPLAVRVKINDLTDNMDIKRIPTLTEKDLTRLMKYHKAYVYLQNVNIENL